MNKKKEVGVEGKEEKEQEAGGEEEAATANLADLLETLVARLAVGSPSWGQLLRHGRRLAGNRLGADS